MLASIYNDLKTSGALCTVEGDKIKWNDKFNVDAYLEKQKRHQAAKAAETQVRTKVKGAVRKYIIPNQAIESSGLIVRVKSVDVDALAITTTVQKVDETWSKVFKPGFDAVWNYVNTLDTLNMFEAAAQLESGIDGQNLLVLENGKIRFDRDA
jgi:hypothetical protein